jgi:hypothetical protein
MPFLISSLVLAFSVAASSQLFAAVRDDLDQEAQGSSEGVVAIVRILFHLSEPGSLKNHSYILSGYARFTSNPRTCRVPGSSERRHRQQEQVASVELSSSTSGARASD